MTEYRAHFDRVAVRFPRAKKKSAGGQKNSVGVCRGLLVACAPDSLNVRSNFVDGVLA